MEAPAKRRTRTRAILKWTGAVVTGAVGAAYLLSAFTAFGWADAEQSITIEGGCYRCDRPSQIPPGFQTTDTRRPWSWRFGAHRMKYASYVEGAPAYVQVPLWAPFLLLILPTAALWQADLTVALRRRTKACLSCGYDRRGLAPDAECPECGSV